MERFDLDHIFKYHPPHSKQPEQYELLRIKAKEFAATIVAIVPEGADQDYAIRKVREALMTANAGIATRGRLFEWQNEERSEPAPRTQTVNRGC
jgi:hypothetical protein